LSDVISRRELIRRFRRLGFEAPISGGRHQFMMKGSLKVRIPNPHKGISAEQLCMRFCGRRKIAPSGSASNLTDTL
jgi:hypothetical protein